MHAKTFHLVEEKKGKVSIFTLDGRLDTHTSPEAEELFAEKIPQEHPNVILDLGSLTYLSSAGIRVLLQVHKQITSRQGHLALVGLSKDIEKILYITGFLPYFKIYDKVGDALEKLCS